jgi:hypothetical protein
MSVKRRAVPAKKPVAARRVPARNPTTTKKPVKKKSPAKKKPAKKSPVKKTIAKKKTVVEKPAAPKTVGPRLIKQAYKEKSLKIRASADARKATRDATMVRAEPDSDVSQTPSKPKPAPRPPRRSAVERHEDAPPAAGAVLIERVVGAIERELTQIDAIVGKSHVLKAQRTEAERRARTLASLARTLTEVRKLRADENKSKAADDDNGPEDINAFRLELAKKLDRLAAEAQVLFPGETDGAGEC